MCFVRPDPFVLEIKKRPNKTDNVFSPKVTNVIGFARFDSQTVPDPVSEQE